MDAMVAAMLNPRSATIGLMCGLILAFWLAGSMASANAEGRESRSPADGFVYLDDIVTDVAIDLRYYGSDNFVGDRITGYLAPRAILTRQAATALAKVQQELRPSGLGIKIFDAYRPQRAVDHFIRWAEDLSDTRMKSRFYPGVDKKNLFRDGYIAARSSHSRGSTVDVTVTYLGPGRGTQDLPMGSEFDFFGPQSWPMHRGGITAPQRAHRLLLRTLMIKHGFNPYPQEWWHFTLKNEPFPNTWFDFPVR